MSQVLIVCGKCRAILGCVNEDNRWDCALCEINRTRFFQNCPWNSWGGKTPKELTGEPTITRTCYACDRPAQSNELTGGRILLKLTPPVRVKVFIHPA